MSESFIVVDSGSSKADWMHYPSGKIFQTKGFNPFYWSMQDIINELKKSIDQLIEFHETGTIYWYGSGCSHPEKSRVISNALKFFFPSAEIIVEHDLLGAARALHGTEKGIACILGTGSNSCLYDGTQIVKNIPSLGFFLGDEGSASHLAKRLLQSFFYGNLLPETFEKFQQKYQLDRTRFLNQLHSSKEPNVLIASFAPFLSENIEQPDVQKIVKDCFRDFFNTQAARYEGFHEHKISFTGSVALAFQPILTEVILEWNGIPGRFVQKPVEDLIEFHKRLIS